MFISHVHSIFAEMSVHVICSFSNWIVDLLLGFVVFLYILDTSPLLNVWLAGIFFFFFALFSLTYSLL